MAALPTGTRQRDLVSPGNSPGQVSHGPAHLHCHPARDSYGSADAKIPPLAHRMLCGQTVINTDFHAHDLAVFL